jgi:metal-dependent amidase/aminoacylase/carboxypeptidase family protein
MPIKNRIAEMHDEIASWHRDFHEHPELLYDTYRTAEIGAAKLREFGCDEMAEGIGRTGVVRLITGRNDSRGRVVGNRADAPR